MDLERRYRDCAALTFAQAQELLGHGISVRSLLGRVRSAKIRLEGELFEFDEQGLEAYVTPVRGLADGEIEFPGGDAALDDLPLLDLVAWHPDAPGHWALWRGATATLGLVEPQHLEPFPVALHRDVLGWLRASCKGLVLLTRDESESFALLHRIFTISATDREHAEHLIRLAARPQPIPTILVGGRHTPDDIWP